MTGNDESVGRRKPLRRTAWGLLVGGLVGVVLMVGVGLLILAGGQEIGPGRPAVWAAGERVSVHKEPGPQSGVTGSCQVIGADGEPEYRWLDWAESVRSTTEVTIACDREAILLTGRASAVMSVLQSSWLMAPVGLFVLGVLLFFPRVTLALTRR